MRQASKGAYRGRQEGKKYSAVVVHGKITVRVPKSWIHFISVKILDDLARNGLIEGKVPREELLRETEQVILHEMMAEDRLNEEVREILRSYEGEIEKKHLDYKSLFDMTKNRLVRERNIVI
jgi:hypothetical protein